jgi:hypothetical protein
MKNVCLVNGSPSGRTATSLVFLKDLDNFLDDTVFQKEYVSCNLKAGDKSHAPVIDAMAGSDALIFSFPLYAYTLPAPFTKLLEDYYRQVRDRQIKGGPARVYAIVNSGYPVPGVNAEALRVMRNFCKRAGLAWRFGVAIGGGLVVAMTRNVPLINRKLRNVYVLIKADILGNGTAALDDISIKPVIPKRMMIYMKDSKWAKRYMGKRPKPGTEPTE